MLNVLIFIGSFFGLFAGITFLIPNIVGLARLLGISEFIIAFIMMSVATSMSELFIGVSSAVQGSPALSFGNILGANFLNIALILGLVMLLNRGFEVKDKISRDNFWLIIAIALAPIILALDGVISRLDGLILLALFFIYILRILKQKIYFTELLSEIKNNNGKLNHFFRKIGLVVIGLVLVAVFSGLLVYSAQNLAKTIHFTFFSFGVVFVALVSTLPELIVAVRSWLLKHPEMAAGNSLGSVVFNSAFIVGVVGLINPIQIEKNGDFFLISVFLILGLILFNLFLRTKNRISIVEAGILFSLYFIFLAIKFML